MRQEEKRARGIAWLPAFPLVYGILTVITARTLNSGGVPPALEGVLAIIVAPSLIIFEPLYPIMRPLGLMEGEWLRAPSFLGIIVGSFVYSILLWVLFRLIKPRWG